MLSLDLVLAAKKTVKDLLPHDWLRVGIVDGNGRRDISMEIYSIIDLPDYPLRCITFLSGGFASITLPMDDEVYIDDPQS